MRRTLPSVDIANPSALKATAYIQKEWKEILSYGGQFHIAVAYQAGVLLGFNNHRISFSSDQVVLVLEDLVYQEQIERGNSIPNPLKYLVFYKTRRGLNADWVTENRFLEAFALVVPLKKVFFE